MWCGQEHECVWLEGCFYLLCCLILLLQFLPLQVFIAHPVCLPQAYLPGSGSSTQTTWSFCVGRAASGTVQWSQVFLAVSAEQGKHLTYDAGKWNESSETEENSTVSEPFKQMYGQIPIKLNTYSLSIIASFCLSWTSFWKRCRSIRDTK